MMKRSNFFVLIMMVLGIGMLVWTFFGWSPNSSDEVDIPQYETTWFVAEIINTWDVIDTWDVHVDNVDTETKGYTEIRVMMPKYFYNTEWKRFAQDLYSEKKVYMKFIFIDDLNRYRQQLYHDDFSWADLFLFPYDWHEKVSLRSFSAEKDIQPYFDQLLSSITKGSHVAFLPFAADPMVMYVLSGYSWLSNFDKISEYVSDRESVRTLSFPLFFGILEEDFEDKWFIWEYQDIVRYALMHYFRANRDVEYLEKWIDNNNMESYNLSDLKTISNVITAPECKNFPSVCFQIFNFVWIRFGFLSDADVVNQYLHNKKSDFSVIKKFPMPFNQLESPVRLRWRWISSSLKNVDIINWVYAFLIQYMNKYDQYNLWNSTLSVFETDEWKWLLDNEYIWLRWYILQSWWDYIGVLKWDDDFQDLIGYRMTAEDYLR